MHPPRISHASMHLSALFHSPLHRPAPIHLRFPIISSFQPSRSAHHASESRANKAKQGPGKRLGAKRGASEHVVPGNIIFRQRGTHWFPGENVGMGRDHTIFAKEKGYVVYYRDKWSNRLGERKFIGVVFERGMTLPRSAGAKRMRRLGMVGRERDMSTMAGSSVEEGIEQEEDESHGTAMTPVQTADPAALTNVGSTSTIRQQATGQRTKTPQSPPQINARYQYRESNWAIGRAAERAGVKVRAYRRSDRWLAWRKKVAAKERTREKAALGAKKKSKK